MHCRLFLVPALVQWMTQFPFAMTEEEVFFMRLNNWRLTENFQTQHINAQVKAKR